MPRLCKKTSFRVRVFCETGIEYFRHIKLGIRHHAFQTGRMEIVENFFSGSPDNFWTGAVPYPFPKAGNKKLLHNLKAEIRRNRIDGIIAQIRERETADALRKLPVPVVDIGNQLVNSPFPVVTQDYAAAGQQAAGHLINCGLRLFRLLGAQGRPIFPDVENGFRKIMVKFAG